MYVCVCVLLTNSAVTFSSRRQEALQSKYAHLLEFVYYSCFVVQFYNVTVGVVNGKGNGNLWAITV